MRSPFYKTLILVFIFCGKLFSQELLDSAQIEAAYTYMDLKEALEHPEMVIRLELKKQKLKTFPPEIFQFKNLQYLSLSKNQLKELPDSIYKLTQLQYLDVSHNKLGSLPKEIGKCSNLVYLNANNNDLFTLPPQIGNLTKLHTLDLWSNDLADFPESLQNLKELTTLDVRAILISDDNMKLLKKWLPNTTIFANPPCNCKL
ncbi:MAG TPA: leucine-rich repeat domain-containing protein [Bacteroidia bacterium]|nr:leucine-rich repeat domain-containing protein [Bacteroidia bacterium]